MRVVLFLVLILLIVIIFAISDEIIKKKNKYRILSVLAICIGVFFLFSTYTKTLQNESHKILLAFEQGKVLICNEIEVNTNSFTFEYGTQSFVAKQGLKQVAGLILPISKCKLK